MKGIIEGFLKFHSDAILSAPIIQKFGDQTKPAHAVISCSDSA